MLAKTMTDRQRYWLNHIQTAAVFEGTTADYARAHDLKIRDIYNWKSKLLKLKLYPSSQTTVVSDFVPVKSPSPKTSLPLHKPIQADRSGCTVMLPNGTQIKFHGELSAGVIRSIMRCVSQSH